MSPKDRYYINYPEICNHEIYANEGPIALSEKKFFVFSP
jgi:hypothetical protein